MQKVGIEDSSVQNDIARLLKSSYGKEHLALSDLESFGKEGLHALAASIKAEGKKRKRAKKRPSRKVRIAVPHHRFDFELDWKYGESILDLSRSPQGDELLGEYIEATCGGQMSCCTCHVYLDKQTFQVLGEPCEAEEDMLDLAYDPQPTSRLGCQVVLDDRLAKTEHDITVTLPSEFNDVWK